MTQMDKVVERCVSVIFPTLEWFNVSSIYPHICRLKSSGTQKHPLAYNLCHVYSLIHEKIFSQAGDIARGSRSHGINAEAKPEKNEKTFKYS